MRRFVIWLCFAATQILIARGVFAQELLTADTPIENAIDHYLDANLKQAKQEASPQAGDANLIRRLTLDLAGRIPATVEVKEFRDSKSPNKRAELVDRLMNSPEFVDQFSDRLDLLLMRDTGGSIRDYLKVAVAENRSWDAIFRDLVLPAQKANEKILEVEFLKRRAGDTDKLTTDVSSLFFGVNVSCAKCHDHPMVIEWTQETFYGMKSFFNRTFESNGYIAEREYGFVKYQNTAGESKDAQLRFFTGALLEEPDQTEPDKEAQKKLEEQIKEVTKNKQPPPKPKYSRRERLIEIALSDEQREFFARSLVNRLWHQYFGYGLVMPLDQMHNANPSIHPDLLNWLARDFIQHGYDLKRLVRGIVMSKAYSRSSVWLKGERPDAELFAVAMVRPLTPMQYARSLSLATCDQTRFVGEMNNDERAKRISDSARTSNSNRFQEPGDDFQVPADEALFFSNSDDVAKGYVDQALFRKLKETASVNEVIDSLYWSIHSREATESERRELKKYLQTGDELQEEKLRAVLWAMLAGTELRFNY